MFTRYKFIKNINVKIKKLKINYVIVNNVNVNSGGNVGGSGSNRNLGVRPALFLKSDVEILSGDGTNDNPFVLE